MPNSHFAISHFEVNEGGFALFSSLLIEIKRLEKEVKEINDKLEKNKGDYLLSELSQLTSIATFLPLPVIICSCGAVHPDLKLGGHKTCPACGNRWTIEEKRISEGGGSSPIITPPFKIAVFADEDEDVGSRITICEGKCEVIFIFENNEVKCFSDDPNIDTLKLEIDIKTAIKFFKL